MASDTPVHILVAADDVLIAWALRSILEEAGYRVTVAHDGEQALAFQAWDPADVLLTDLLMPRLDGHGLIRVLQAERPMLPVIVMTGAADASGLTGLRGRVAAGTIIMAKPVSPHPVLTDLRDLLRVSGVSACYRASDLRLPKHCGIQRCGCTLRKLTIYLG